MEISHLPDAQFKTPVISVLKELCEDINSIKKFQSEVNDSLIEIKNNLQGNKSRVHEAENQINNWNIKKQKTTNQNNKKEEESTKMRIV